MTPRVVRDDAAGRAEAVAILRGGGVVALPTDTVYGIAAALSTAGGVERLFFMKRRPSGKGIVLLLADAAQAALASHMNPAATALAAAAWPGGLTIVVPQRPDVRWPRSLTGGAPTIGLRVADHDAPRTLARSLGPLPTTSANVSGRPAASDPADIAEQFGDAIDLVLDGGPAGGGPASTVVDCSVDRVVITRVGAVSSEEIAAILDRAGVPHDLD